MVKLKYLATTISNQDFIYEEIESWLNLGNACYHPVQDLLSFRLASTNVIKIYKT
jgi:hypothetical protein